MKLYIINVKNVQLKVFMFVVPSITVSQFERSNVDKLYNNIYCNSITLWIYIIYINFSSQIIM